MSSTSSPEYDEPTKSKPWSSGRVMTAAQRERKRRMDRLKQKERRLQTTQLVDDLNAQVDRLTTKLASLEGSTTVMPNMDPTSLTEMPLTPDSLELDSQSTLTYTSDELDQPLYLASPNNYVPNFLFPSVWKPDSSMSLEHSFSDTEQVDRLGSKLWADSKHQSAVDPLQPLGLNSLAFRPQQQKVGEQHNAVAEISTCAIQDTINDLMRQACMAAKQSICTNEQLNQDALIRGIVQGWNLVNARQYHCPLWAVIQQIDESFFFNSSIINRFCTLRMTHYVLLYLTGVISESDLPQFYRPRPSQKRFVHDMAVDVLAWPGMRERAVVDQDFTRSDKFWRELIGYFQFYWPYEVNDAFRLDHRSGLFTFSELYERQASEIRMWQMHPDFFVSFPDTCDDIIQAEAPPVHTIRPSKQTRVTTNEDSAGNSGDSV